MASNSILFILFIPFILFILSNSFRRSYTLPEPHSHILNPSRRGGWIGSWNSTLRTLIPGDREQRKTTARWNTKIGGVSGGGVS